MQRRFSLNNNAFVFISVGMFSVMHTMKGGRVRRKVGEDRHKCGNAVESRRAGR